MREEADQILDSISIMAPKRSALDAYLFGYGTQSGHTAGGAVLYKHRISNRISAFGKGELGYQIGSNSGLYWSALAGLRGEF